MGIAVVCMCDAPETLLTSRVPDLRKKIKKKEWELTLKQLP